MAKHRPVEEIIADRKAAHAAMLENKASFERFDGELRALKATIDHAMKPAMQ